MLAIERYGAKHDWSYCNYELNYHMKDIPTKSACVSLFVTA
jgi:hypothetical protein